MVNSKTSTTTRQSILDAALQAFNHVGYEGTTVAAICQASGVSNGSFFHHFGSKEGVAGALFLEALGNYHAALTQDLPACPGAPEGIVCLIAAHMRWVVAHRAEARFMFEQVRPEWLEPIRAAQQGENGVFASAIESWRKPLIDAAVFDDVPAQVFFSQVMGPAQMVCRGWLSAKTDSDPLQHVAFLTRSAIRALVHQPTPSQRKLKK